ncbi:hypothetical protein ANN_26347 [Periplaneta americana]|uniref:DUF659 domain-containing protein n=1 Tax=Periplaneta americana TaxID=6978 RepID=A0ABQ8S5M3_PERAM|nr:hypothetical protein ANN_26347 [Periplaneta americana]
MIHITCIVHGLHHAAEEIRSQNPKANNLISLVKKIFVKAPARTAHYSKKNYQKFPFHQSWINAAFYYCSHIEDIKKAGILSCLISSSSSSSSSITIHQDVLDPCGSVTVSYHLFLGLPVI